MTISYHIISKVPTIIDEGYYKINDIVGCDALNGRLVTVTHPYKDPVKTVRATLEGLSGLEDYNGGGNTKCSVAIKFGSIDHSSIF